MKKTTKFSPEMRERAVRRVFEQREQHGSVRYSERLAEAGIGSSVGGKGDGDGDALAETINGLYKAETNYYRNRSEQAATA